MGISAYERDERAGNLPEDVCEMCHGTKLTTVLGMCGGVEMDCDDQPCPLCQDDE